MKGQPTPVFRVVFALRAVRQSSGTLKGFAEHDHLARTTPGSEPAKQFFLAPLKGSCFCLFFYIFLQVLRLIGRKSI